MRDGFFNIIDEKPKYELKRVQRRLGARNLRPSRRASSSSTATTLASSPPPPRRRRETPADVFSTFSSPRARLRASVVFLPRREPGNRREPAGTKKRPSLSGPGLSRRSGAAGARVALWVFGPDPNGDARRGGGTGARTARRTTRRARRSFGRDGRSVEIVRFVTRYERLRFNASRVANERRSRRIQMLGSIVFLLVPSVLSLGLRLRRVGAASSALF